MKRVPCLLTTTKPRGRAAPLMRKPSPPASGASGAAALGSVVAREPEDARPAPPKLTSIIRMGMKVTDPAVTDLPTTALTPRVSPTRRVSASASSLAAGVGFAAGSCCSAACARAKAPSAKPAAVRTNIFLKEHLLAGFPDSDRRIRFAQYSSGTHADLLISGAIPCARRSGRHRHPSAAEPVATSLTRQLRVGIRCADPRPRRPRIEWRDTTE